MSTHTKKTRNTYAQAESVQEPAPVVGPQKVMAGKKQHTFRRKQIIELIFSALALGNKHQHAGEKKHPKKCRLISTPSFVLVLLLRRSRIRTTSCDAIGSSVERNRFRWSGRRIIFRAVTPRFNLRLEVTTSHEERHSFGHTSCAIPCKRTRETVWVVGEGTRSWVKRI